MFLPISSSIRTEVWKIDGSIFFRKYFIKLYLKLALKHRTGHTLISKTGKEIERNFVSDLTCLTKNEKNFDSDPKLHKRVNALITEHLTSTGKFEVAETLLKVTFFLSFVLLVFLICALITFLIGIFGGRIL